MKLKDGFKGERALVLPNAALDIMQSEKLSSLLYPTAIGYYPSAKYHFRNRKVPIPEYIFGYVVEGGGWFKINGQVHKVERNQYYILPPGISHSYAADEKDPWTIYWIHFKGELAELYSPKPGFSIDIYTSIRSRISNRLTLFEEIYQVLENGYSRENLSYACSVFHHFMGTLQYQRQYHNMIKTNDGEIDLVDAAIHYMKENINRKVSLKEIANYIGYSRSHFSAVFSLRIGFSPLSYFNHLKIQKACQLIDFSDIKINQVCYKVGIDDCYYFSRLFHSIMGISPLEYKKKNHQSDIPRKIDL